MLVCGAAHALGLLGVGELIRASIERYKAGSGRTKSRNTGAQSPRRFSS